MQRINRAVWHQISDYQILVNNCLIIGERETERERDRKTDRETERQKTERQRDREIERQRDRKTERQTDRDMKIEEGRCWCNGCNELTELCGTKYQIIKYQ